MKKGSFILLVLLLLLLSFHQAGMQAAVKTVRELSDREHPKVAITFDDGPHPVYTEMLLDGLKERGVHAAFFLIGKNIEGNEEIVKRMQEEGHLIGNHTYHHVNLKELSQKEAEKEIQMTWKKIYESTGVGTSFVRPPFGEWRKNLDFDIIMIPVSWNIDSLDWTTENTEKIIKRVVKDVGEDDIILMHDVYETSVEAALEIIDILRERGYEFVTVDQLLLE